MKKKIITIAIGVVGLALLAAAAFLAPRLFSSNPDQSGAKPVAAGVKGSRGDGPIKLPADELPKSDYDLAGQVIRVKDNSIFISPAFLDVDEVEVVVTPDTKIYLYDGEETISENADGTPATIKNKLLPITIKDLAVDDILSVWADQRGDRYIATYINALH